MPIGNAQMKVEGNLDLWELFVFPTLLLFFTVGRFKEYSWLQGSLYCTGYPLRFLEEISKKDK